MYAKFYPLSILLMISELILIGKMYYIVPQKSTSKNENLC
ncbi:MAG: hypothetical protein RIR48_1501 [Bacteroidota bacterium]|jgi:hypothetical protein